MSFFLIHTFYRCNFFQIPSVVVVGGIRYASKYNYTFIIIYLSLFFFNGSGWNTKSEQSNFFFLERISFTKVSLKKRHTTLPLVVQKKKLVEQEQEPLAPFRVVLKY